MDVAALLIRLFEDETRFALIREGCLALRRSFPGPPPFDPPGVAPGRRRERVPLGAFVRGLAAAERPEACLVALSTDLPRGFDGAVPAAERQVLSHVLDSGGRVADLYHHDRNRPFPGLQLEALRQLPGALVASAPGFTLAAGLVRAREAGPAEGESLAWVHAGPHRTTVFCLRERRPRAGFRLTAVFAHRTPLLNPGKLEDYILRTVAGNLLDEEIRLDGGLFAEIRSEAGVDERPEILLHDPSGAFRDMPGVVRVPPRDDLDLEEEGMLAALRTFRLPLLRLQT